VIVALVLINLISCCLIAISALWLVTDSTKARGARICCGIICCGSLVNVNALWVAFANMQPSHPMTWPTEAVLNVGAAVLLGRWALKGWLARATEIETAP
jgi:hypothetical protein